MNIPKDLRELLIHSRDPSGETRLRDKIGGLAEAAILHGFQELRGRSLRLGNQFWEKPETEVRFVYEWVETGPSTHSLKTKTPDDEKLRETPEEELQELTIEWYLGAYFGKLAPPSFRREREDGGFVVSVSDELLAEIDPTVRNKEKGSLLESDRLRGELREEVLKRIAPRKWGSREFRWYPEEPVVAEDAKGRTPRPLSEYEPRAVSIDIPGRGRFSTFAELGQLTVEVDEKHAYFPLTVGLAVEKSEHPTTWPEEELSRFWNGLLEKLEANAKAAIATEEGLLDLSPLMARARAREEVEGATDAKRTDVALAESLGVGESVSVEVIRKAEVGPEVTGIPYRQTTEMIVLHDAPTMRDRGALALTRNLSFIARFPRKMSEVPAWEKLVQDEIQRLQDERGDEPFQTIGGPGGRKPLLRRRTTYQKGENGNAIARELVELTPEGEEALLSKWNDRWFSRRQKDPDKAEREYIVRHLPTRDGYLEARLSLYGSSWRLIEAAREKEATTAKETLSPPSQLSLLPDGTSETERKRMADYLQHLGIVKDALGPVMRALLDEYGATLQNPIRMEMAKLRHLLGLENHEDGPARVRGTLQVLNNLHVNVKASGVEGFSGQAFGNFVSEVRENKGGPGKHTEGTFLITLAPSAIGGLQIFSSAKHRENNPKKLLVGLPRFSKEEKQTLREHPYDKSPTKLGAFYDRHFGLDDHQQRIREWIEREITQNKDGITKDRRRLRLKRSDADADEPRIYDSSFCPLLPAGEQFVGALGHFESRKGGGAERGRRLYGQATPPARTGKSGGRAGGLLYQFGYETPKTSTQKEKVVRLALEDLHRVAEDLFEGRLVAKMKGAWLTLENAQGRLSTEELLKTASWFVFLPTDWLNRVHAKYNALQKKRAEEGKTNKVFQIQGVDEPAIPLERPLRERLRKAMEDRHLTLAALGKLFGVSKMAVSKWLATDPGKGTNVSSSLAPFVERWIENETVPTPEELPTAKRQKGGP